jgi:hypothetical protein
MLQPLHLFIIQEARQAKKWVLYEPNFGHSEVLIKMTGEMHLLLTSRSKFVTLNILGRKFSVVFHTREGWSRECVDLATPDEPIFFTELVPAYSLTF